MSNALVPVSDLERMAQAVSASKLFGITNPEQALALMLVAQAEGLHPATAARDYHIIQGRPALKADAMLARYLNSGGKVEWHDHTDAKVSATFSHPNGGTLRIEWDMDRAKKAGLAGKDNWSKWPRQMLRARVISEGIRATNPAVAVGIYTPEEVQDFEPAAAATVSRGSGRKAEAQPRREKDMGAAVVVDPDDEALKAKEQEPATPHLGDVLHAISQAKTAEELKAVSTMAAALTDETQKQLARGAYAERAKELKPKAEAAAAI